MRFGATLAFLLVLAARAAQAERLVDNAEMCSYAPDDIAQYELGSELTNTGFHTIEYHCEWEPAMALSLGQDSTQSRAGYCEEPGFLEPSLFVLRTFTFEPDVAYLYQSGSDTPTEFRPCP